MVVDGPLKLEDRIESVLSPRRWVSGTLRKLYDHRIAITSILAIVLIGLAWGSLLRHSATSKQERMLTPELSEQEYEELEARDTRPPPGIYGSTVIGTAIVFAATGIFFLIYETLRLVLQAGLVKLVGRHRRGDPKATRSSGGGCSTRPETIGKLIFIAGMSLVLGIYWARDSVEKLEAAQAPALEDPRTEAESPVPETECPPADPANHLLSGIFGSAVLVGVYELAGVLAAAAIALWTGGTISRGAHVFLSSFGFIVFGLGAMLLVFGVARHIWPEEPSWWMVVLCLIGIVAVVNVLERFFEAIPIPCTECDGKAYLTSPKPIVYECRECRHVQRV